MVANVLVKVTAPLDNRCPRDITRDAAPQRSSAIFLLDQSGLIDRLIRYTQARPF